MTRLLALVVVLAGCGGTVITVSGIEVREEVWQEAAEHVSRQASFALRCPASQLRLHLLARYRRQPTRIGIEGCGQRAVFRRAVASMGGRSVISNWSMESSTVPTASRGRTIQPQYLRARLDAESDAIRRCGAFRIRVTWDIRGELAVQVPNGTHPAVHECVRAVLDVRIQPGGGGQLEYQVP